MFRVALFSFIFSFHSYADILGAGGNSSGAAGPGPDNPEVQQGCDAAFAARLSLASMYGSCDAPAAAKGSGVPADSTCQSMPRQNPGSLAQVWSSAKQCSSPYAKKPEYSKEGARMSINGNQIDPAPDGKTDCSGFFSGVAARMGWRLQPNKDLTGPTTTKELISLVTGGQSCFDEVTNGVQAGDISVNNDGNEGHVKMIDRVAGSSGCEYSIIESSGGNDPEYGGPRVVVKGGAGGGGAVSDNAGAQANRMSPSCVQAGGGTHKIVRFNAQKAGCKGTPKQFKNEQCVKSCPTLGWHSPEMS